MNQTPKKGPLERAIYQESAEWLEVAYPGIFEALSMELNGGKSLDDIRKILRREFADEIRKPLEARIIQAYQHLKSEQLSTA